MELVGGGNKVELIEVNSRQEAEYCAYKDSKENDFYYLHPSDHIETIAGAGTVCFESLEEIHQKSGIIIDDIFASCGGGGLVAGCFIAAGAFFRNIVDNGQFVENINVIACEPDNANDGYISFNNKKIHQLQYSPDTVADGLRALSVSKLAFKYIKYIKDFILLKEEEIEEYTSIINNITSLKIETSAAISFAGVIKYINNKRNLDTKIDTNILSQIKFADIKNIDEYKYIQDQHRNKRKNILVILSGGNADNI
ncbi:MAG TPA: pyridoxal-phosphate dependent enzyme [Candidatus Megaira endosymbiont of Hartmannula sinica]|nr:pyridoxal-phosphate dependent enzyme [Candidatus Megaera endosymbiont of Hartmannula sinica]